MRIEPKAAFYNEETGAVQPWKDIEVTDSVGNALVSEGLAIAIAEGGGGGGDYNSLTMTAIGDGGLLYAYAGRSGDYYTCVFATEDGLSHYVGPVNNGEEKVITVLFNGDSVSVSIPPNVTEVSGNATYDSETETLTATGDFTVKGHYAD